MNNECSHDEYYSQFVSEGLKNAVSNAIGKDRIIVSENHHFNDIQLNKWDSLSGLIGSYCGKMLGEANGNGYYSLSDTVCVAKAAAKMICGH